MEVLPDQLGGLGEAHMTKLHFVRRARKTYRGTGVKKGMPYWWWKFQKQPRRISLTKPPRSALVRSPFLSALLDLEDRYESLNGNRVCESEEEVDDFNDEVDEIASDLEQLAEECEEARSNMADKFPNGCPTMELLEQRVERCREIAEELRNGGVNLDWEVE